MVILIPAYKPPPTILAAVAQLTREKGFTVVVVDDGSGDNYRTRFQKLAAMPAVTVLHHALNAGKGAALKTGMNYAVSTLQVQDGIVTADADGQHAVEDIARVAAMLERNPGDLVLGIRRLEGQIPLRSKLGNALARVFLRLVTGRRLADTQTGLRGIPASLIPHLVRIKLNGYAFESAVLISAPYQGSRVVQQPIQTIYLKDNSSSHFRPLVDSGKIFLVLMRLVLARTMGIAFETGVFLAVFAASGSLLLSQIVARAIESGFGFKLTRRAMFISDQREGSLMRYLALVIASGAASYAVMRLILSTTGLSIISAKLLAEMITSLATFHILRDFVFVKRRAPEQPSQSELSPEAEHYSSR